MALYDGKGNSISVGSDGLATILPDADLVVFGDSNVYYTYGHSLTNIGSVFHRLWLEFGVNTLINKGQNGINTYGVYSTIFKAWAEEAANQEAYNKENTILIFHCGTNDQYDWWTYGAEDGATGAKEGVRQISKLIETYFPKAQYFWVIPTATDWSKWTGSTAADGRNMDEKYPLIKETMETYHFPYIDAYNQSGITTEMLSDGIHLGGGGSDYTTIAVEKFYRFLRGKLITL